MSTFKISPALSEQLKLARVKRGKLRRKKLSEKGRQGFLELAQKFENSGRS
ncbi:hypothetical protein ABEW05_010206 [Botrytis cinerea]